MASDNPFSEHFLNIELILLDTKVSANGVCVTKEWIDQIVENEKDYIATPLYCDVESLISYGKLDHNYNPITETFDTTQIGSIVEFRSFEEDDVSYLVGIARIPKRNEKIVGRILELDDEDSLLFSYEIEAVDMAKIDGVQYILDSKRNKLSGVAIVTNPAIEEAKALMVASAMNLSEGAVDTVKEEEKKKNCSEEVAAKEEKTVDEKDKEEETTKEEEKVTVAQEPKDKEDEEEENAEDPEDTEDDEEEKEMKVASEDVDEEKINLIRQVSGQEEMISSLRRELDAFYEETRKKEEEEHRATIMKKVAFFEAQNIDLTDVEQGIFDNAVEHLWDAEIDSFIVAKLMERSQAKPKTETASEKNQRTESIVASIDASDAFNDSIVSKYFS